MLMWEVFSFGQSPYPGLTNSQAREKVDDGMLITYYTFKLVDNLHNSFVTSVIISKKPDTVTNLTLLLIYPQAYLE